MKPAILTLLLVCPLALVGCSSQSARTSDGQNEIVITDCYMVLKPVGEAPPSDVTGLVRHFENPAPESTHNQFTCPTCGLFRVH